MKNIKLIKIRYWLEMISSPVFAWLVIGMAGESLMIFLNNHFPDFINFPGKFLGISSISIFETIGGFLILLIFISLWRISFLQKLVPCNHSHCHHSISWSHFLATTAFIFHFLPESILRAELLQNITWNSWSEIIILIGFVGHFLIDILVIILLSNGWNKFSQKIIFFSLMIISWLFIAFANFDFSFQDNEFIMIISAFLLTMFVHLPHKK
jgi:hypothetical protein